MGYILLSVIITLAELSASFLFVNYLQEIYLFDLYKALGFSVNLGYFVSIVIFVIVYFLFSGITNKVIGKNINYLSGYQVGAYLKEKDKDDKHMKTFSIKNTNIVENIITFQFLISATYVVLVSIFHQSIIFLLIMMVGGIMVFMRIIKDIFRTKIFGVERIILFFVIFINFFAVFIDIFSKTFLSLSGDVSIFIKICLLFCINAVMLFMYTVYKKAFK